jgi:apolipoprotein N-acyltransferase
VNQRIKLFARHEGIGIAAALGTGLAIALAFPDYEWWPLIWIAFIPLLFALRNAGFKKAFWLGLLAGTTANVVGFFWMVNLLYQFGHLPYPVSVGIMLPGAAWQGLSVGLAFGLAIMLQRKGWPLWLTLPLFYTGFEAFHPILFPWYLGNCLYRQLSLIQIADVFGVSVFTTLIVGINVCLFMTLEPLVFRVRPRPWKRLIIPPAVAVLSITGILLYGSSRLDHYRVVEADSPTLTVGVVEPEIGIFEEQQKNYPPDLDPLTILRWNNIRLHRASHQLEQDGVDLIVWPESSFFPVLSTYGSQSNYDWLAIADKQVHMFREQPGENRLLEVGQPLHAGFARNEHEAYLVGTDGALYRFANSQLVREPTGTDKQLHAVHIGCLKTPELVDTHYDRCVAVAAGAKGTLLVRTMDGWAAMHSGLDADLLTISGHRLDDLAVGGDGVLAAGRIETGITLVKATPGQRWIRSVRGRDRILFVAASGHLATFRLDAESDTGQFVLLEVPEGLSGEVTDIGRMADGDLLFATTTGLFRFADGKAIPLAVDKPMQAVSCHPSGNCLAAGTDGTFWEVKDFRLIAHNRKIAGVTSLIPLPFTRHYWWLPADLTRLYQAPSSVLPDSADYRLAIAADETTPIKEFNAVQRGFSTPLLFGSTSGVLNNLEHPNSLDNIRYNSAFLLDEDGYVQGRYDKQYLLTFGEYIPGGEMFPFLYEWSPSSGRFRAGPDQANLNFAGFRLGVLICYEDILPSHTNQVAMGGAHALFNLTNDAWFGKTKEAIQHFALSVFRSIEQRRPMLRSTTTGISGMISSTGEITAMTDLYEAESFVTRVPMLTGTTLYRQGGRHYGMALFFVSLALLLYAANRTRQERKKKRRKSTSRQGP